MTDGKKTILIIDGELISTAEEKTLLENYGYAVITAAYGKKAVEAALTTSEVNLILISGGADNGSQVAATASQILQIRRLPIVFLLSGAHDTIIEKTETIAHYGYAFKGSGGAALNANIKTALRLFEADIKIKDELTCCRQAEEYLQAKDEKLTLMINGVRALLAYIDSDLRFVLVNKSYADWYGLPAKDIEGKKIGDLLTKEVYERALPNYLKVLGGEIVSFENRTLDKEGKESYVGVTLVPHFCDNKVTGFFGSITDITKRKLAEEEIKRQLLDKEILLREVHHRIRNNITTIAGLLTIQAQSSHNAQIKTALTDSVARVKSMCVLYDKLLISDEYKELSAKNYIESLVDIIAGLFSENTEITIDKQITEFNLISNKLFTLGLIINELLTNIMKYAFIGRKNGRIKIILDKVDSHITLIVNDDGRGLPEGFDSNNSGGFGLMLISMLAQQLGGSYTIKSYNGTESVLKFDA
jgi:PAS domain S-box-containing protein